LASANIYNLKQVDYAERGQQVEIIVDGVPKRQTVIFSGTDYFGEKYYFTEQGLRYIQDSRHRRPQQNLVLNYLNKIPIILKSPQVISRNIRYPDRHLFCDKVSIKERGNKKCLFAVVLSKANINVVWNFYWLEESICLNCLKLFTKAKTSGNVNGDHYDLPAKISIR
jgi:hypothetical protein